MCFRATTSLTAWRHDAGQWARRVTIFGVRAFTTFSVSVTVTVFLIRSSEKRVYERNIFRRGGISQFLHVLHLRHPHGLGLLVVHDPASVFRALQHLQSGFQRNESWEGGEGGCPSPPLSAGDENYRPDDVVLPSRVPGSPGDSVTHAGCSWNST